MLFVLGSVVIFVPYFYTHASFLHSSVTPMKLPHFPRVRPFPGVVAWAWHLIHFDPPSPLYTCTSYFTTCNLSRCLGLWGCSCQVIIDVLVLVVRACSRCRCLNSSPPPSPSPPHPLPPPPLPLPPPLPRPGLPILERPVPQFWPRHNHLVLIHDNSLLFPPMLPFSSSSPSQDLAIVVSRFLVVDWEFQRTKTSGLVAPGFAETKTDRAYTISYCKPWAQAGRQARPPR